MLDEDQRRANERELRFDRTFQPPLRRTRHYDPPRYGITSGGHTSPERRFLMVPELNAVEKWKFEQVIDHPFFKGGPYLVWQSSRGRSVQINRDLFYAQMKGKL